MIYRSFHVGRFRGVADVGISFQKGDLVLLVGLNESGKTTILKAIEAFDHRNDPPGDYTKDFLRSIRNKSDLYSNDPAVISAEIELEKDLRIQDFRHLFKGETVSSDRRALVEAFLGHLNSKGGVRLQRVFPFKKGNPGTPLYQFDSSHPMAEQQTVSDAVARRIVELSPFILYFEDFTDRIPEKIFANSTNSAFNPDWYDIVDGLFFNTRADYSVEEFKKLYSKKNPRLDDAKTVMKRVNKTLNSVFTKKWEELSGVQDIEETELLDRFTARSPYFEIKVTDTDGTTYSVDERSKGALWYLSFLMKTEFRRKKIRQDSGKPIFLIDEPASNLHSTAQRNMLGDFRTLVEDTSVIYTTHSQYLVSLENIKNAYVIRRESGVVSATVWADYLKEDAPVVSHYQPLANLPQIVPNTLDAPWDRALITEGVSDKDVLELMHDKVLGTGRGYVIYPGTSAHNLATLISLNLGWGATFRVILDSDRTGVREAKRYREEFELSEEVVQVLPLKNKRIEQYFTEAERRRLYELAFDRQKKGKVTKNQFRKAVSIVNARTELREAALDEITIATAKRFESLFNALNWS